MKTYLLSLFATLSFMTASCQQFSWMPLADLPVPKYAPYSFMIGNRFFIGTGIDTLSPNVALSDLLEYDFTNDAWLARTPIPSGLTMFGSSSFVINGKAYICNGSIIPGSYNNNGALWEYDPTGNSWVQKSSFIGSPAYTSSSFSIGPYGYLGLGYSPYTKVFYRYDSQADQWSQIDSLPGVARQSASAFVIDGVGYVGLGGVQSGGSTFNNFTDFYKYDTATGHWSAIASFPGQARRDAAAFTFNNKGYVIGGVGTNPTDIFKDVWEYTPQTNSWLQKDSFGFAFRDGGVASNGSMAIVGSGPNGNMHLSKQMWKTGFPAAINEVKENPAQIWYSDGLVNINFEQPLFTAANFALYDVSGREILQVNPPKGEISSKVPVASLASGIYIYTLTISH